MIFLSDEDLKLKLLAGLPIPIGNLGELRPLKLIEIIKMTETKYNTYLSALLLNKNQLDVRDDVNLDEYTNFQVLISVLVYDVAFRNVFIEALQMFFNVEVGFIEEYGIVYFGDLSEERVLTEEFFDYIQKVLKIANFIKDEEPDYVPGNERARKFIEKLKKKKAKLPKKQKISLHSLISALGWKKDIDRVLNLTVYQLYDGYQRLEYMDNYYYTLTGIYSGTINAKDINLSNINWANIIK